MKLFTSFLLLATSASCLHAQAPGPAAPKKKRVLTTAAAAAQPTVQNSSLVKVNATSQSYNLHLPWQKESPSSRRGLGVVLAGNRVLVTGQMVADATYIELELPVYHIGFLRATTTVLPSVAMLTT